MKNLLKKIFKMDKMKIINLVNSSKLNINFIPDIKTIHKYHENYINKFKKDKHGYYVLIINDIKFIVRQDYVAYGSIYIQLIDKDYNITILDCETKGAPWFGDEKLKYENIKYVNGTWDSKIKTITDMMFIENSNIENIKKIEGDKQKLAHKEKMAKLNEKYK